MSVEMVGGSEQEEVIEVRRRVLGAGSVIAAMTEEELQAAVEADRALDDVVRAKYTTSRYANRIKESETTETAQADLDAAPPTLDALKIYLDSIGRVALLDAQQEVDLAKRIEAGLYAERALAATEQGEVVDGVQPYDLTPNQRRDLRQIITQGRAAKTHLTEANMRLVVAIAKRYQGNMPFLDLIQEGNTGLIRGVEKFDYAKGNKFSTYATWWIRQAITRATADQARTIRLPVHVVEKINKMARVRRELSQSLGRTATDEELSAEMGITVETIADYDEISREPVSLHMPVGEEDGATLGDFIADSESATPEAIAIIEQQNRHIHDMLEILPERDRRIMMLRFGLEGSGGKTLQEIGQEVGLTRERVRQIERASTEKLRASEYGVRLQGYLDS